MRTWPSFKCTFCSWSSLKNKPTKLHIVLSIDAIPFARVSQTINTDQCSPRCGLPPHHQHHLQLRGLLHLHCFSTPGPLIPASSRIFTRECLSACWPLAISVLLSCAYHLPTPPQSCCGGPTTNLCQLVHCYCCCRLLLQVGWDWQTSETSEARRTPSLDYVLVKAWILCQLQNI